MLGVPEEYFWDSTPAEMQPYVKMDEMRQKRLDAQMWQMGLYVLNAVSVAVSNNLNGRKSKARYMDKPITLSAKVDEAKSHEADIAKFIDWATVFNRQFKNRQGT